MKIFINVFIRFLYFLDKATMDIFVNGFKISDAMVRLLIFICNVK